MKKDLTMKRNANICKAVSVSLALFVSASPFAHAMDPLKDAVSALPFGTGQLRDHGYYKAELQKLEESTRRIHTEVDRMLAEFRKNMAKYRLHTGSKEVPLSTASSTSSMQRKPIDMGDDDVPRMLPPPELTEADRGEIKPKEEPPQKIVPILAAAETEAAAAKKTEGEAKGEVREVPHDVVKSIISMIRRNKAIEDVKSDLSSSQKEFFNVPVRLDLGKLGSLVNDAVLAKIVEYFPMMSELNLSGCKNITDEGLEPLKNLKYLTSLNLAGTGVTDKGREHVKSLVNLTNLNLTSTGVTDVGLGELVKDLGKLISLNLAGTKITDAGLGELVKDLGKQLVTLNLAFCRRITNEGLNQHLKGLENLKDLNLTSTGITDAGLGELVKDLGKQLVTLNLAFCTQITNKGLKHLKDLENLTSLDLGNLQVTFYGVQYVKYLTKLEYLDLTHLNGITGERLNTYLKNLTKLKVLILTGVDEAVTKSDIEELKKTHPALSVRHN